MAKSGKRNVGRGQPVGVWNRGAGAGPANPIRVRTKRLDEIEGDKIALAYWLLAKQLVVDRTDARRLTEAEARRAAGDLDVRPGGRPRPAAGRSAKADGRETAA